MEEKSGSNSETRPASGSPLVDAIIQATYEVANTLGKGFLEKVYEEALVHELGLRGHSVRQQPRFPVFYKDKECSYYVPDFVVDETMIIELKVAADLTSAHLAQCLNAMRASRRADGMVIAFTPRGVKWRKLSAGHQNNREEPA